MTLNRRQFIKSMFLAGTFVLVNPFSFFKKDMGEKNNGKNIVRGVYVPGWKGITKKSIDNYMELKDSHGINTLMIDVKNVRGNLFYSPENNLARDIEAQVKTLEGKKRELNFDYLFNQAHKNNINLVARHAMFRDHLLYDKKLEFRLWEGKYQKWIDMMNKDVVNYNLDLLKEESRFGFNNIVLDYIRFPASKKFDNEEYECEIIDDVVKKAKNKLGDNVDLGVQTFGHSSWNYRESGVGQRIDSLSKYADTIYPMLYPSHFWEGSLGFLNPSEHPYEIIEEGYKQTKKKISNKTKIIPMIQAFNYSGEMFRKQISAVEDFNMDGFVCWNSRGNYYVFNE